MNKWTLSVYNYGKIREAKITVSPLNFFIGDNNSGKSYLMTLLYGLLKFPAKNLFKYMPISEEVKNWTRGFISKVTRQLEVDPGYNYVIEEEDKKYLFLLLNKYLDLNKKQIITDLFNESIDIEKIWIEYDKDKKYRLYVDEESEADTSFITIICCEYREKRIGRGFNLKEEIKDAEYYSFLSMLFIYLLRSDICDPDDDITYLPTTRTGFVLTYKTLSSEAVEQVYSFSKEDDKPKNRLTKPSIDFIKIFSSIGEVKEHSRQSDLIDFIDNNLIEGTVKTDELPMKNIRYITKWDKKDMPLYVTSGVVTEVVPIDIIIRYTDSKVVFYEEPEISMHPQLQQQMARLLIRLANSGIMVFVTTHSDIIMQHVNNMIKIYNIEEPQKILDKLHYSQEDIVKKDTISVFQFKNIIDDSLGKSYSEVKQLECGKKGFKVETFYDALVRMSEELDIIEEV